MERAWGGDGLGWWGCVGWGGEGRCECRLRAHDGQRRGSSRAFGWYELTGQGRARVGTRAGGQEKKNKHIRESKKQYRTMNKHRKVTNENGERETLASFSTQDMCGVEPEERVKEKKRIGHREQRQESRSRGD